MSDKSIEKTLLYLIVLSIALHVAVYTGISLIPPEPQKIPKDPTMVELRDLPELLEPSKPGLKGQGTGGTGTGKKHGRGFGVQTEKHTTRFLPPDKQLPQAHKEAAPKAENKTERIVTSKNAPTLPGRPEPPKPGRSLGKQEQILHPTEKGGKEAARGEGLLQPQRGDQHELAKLFPSARKLANLEESYRKKYLDAEQGDTRLMDTDDPTVGGFTRRLKSQVISRLNTLTPRSIWLDRGRTILLITITREGSIDKIETIESTGNHVLDELAITSVRTSGYVGPLPRSWQHDKLSLIYSFTIHQGGMAIDAAWE